MRDWIELGIYAAGYVFTYRKVFVALVEGMTEGLEDDNFDRAMGGFLSLLISTLWPIVLAGYFFWKLLTPKTSAQIEEEQYQKEQELRERERKVAQMERDLGIGR